MRAQGVSKRAVGIGTIVVALAWTALGTESSETTQAPDAQPRTPTTPPPATTNAPPGSAIQPARVNLPPQLQEVVRLAQAGVGDDVIIAYIHRADATIPITADQILYLKDLGISPNVLGSLLEFRPLKTEPGGESSSTGQPTLRGTDTNDLYAPPPEDVGSSAVPILPPLAGSGYYPGDAGYFSGALAPYGSWMNVAGYGWCWQPTASTIDRKWQPYCNEGNWVWSDSGWYWNSNYSWGGAPFHYGRWFQVPHRGWLWQPDREWGPAWVCWRESEDYCGWAPLPPGARFSGADGWSFRGKHVEDPLFDFSLPARSFTFIPKQHFTDERVLLYRVPGQEIQAIFVKTKPHHDIEIGPNHRVFNRGIAPEHIEAFTHQPIRQVSLRELQGRALIARGTGIRNSPYTPSTGRPPMGRLGFDHGFGRPSGSGGFEAAWRSPWRMQQFGGFASQVMPPGFVAAAPSVPRELPRPPILPASPMLPAPLGSWSAPFPRAPRALPTPSARPFGMHGTAFGAAKR